MQNGVKVLAFSSQESKFREVFRFRRRANDYHKRRYDGINGDQYELTLKTSKTTDLNRTIILEKGKSIRSNEDEIEMAPPWIYWLFWTDLNFPRNICVSETQIKKFDTEERYRISAKAASSFVNLL